MEEIKQKIEEWWPQIETFIEELTPLQWGIIGGVFLLLVILRLIFGGSGKRKRKRQRLEIAPQLMLHAFQIAPLGRDAFFKVKNNGETATISTLSIKGRKDIAVKNAYAGHQIEKEKVYGILLETTSMEKIKKNFTIELNYMDQAGNVYRQDFPLDQPSAQKPKLVKVK